MDVGSKIEKAMYEQSIIKYRASLSLFNNKENVM